MDDHPNELMTTQLDVVLDCLPMPSLLVGRDFVISAANERFRSFYANGREILGRPCYEVSHGATRPCALAGAECPLRSSSRSGLTCRSLHLHQTPRGIEHVEVTVRPIRDAAGNVISFIESLRSSEIASTTPHGDRLVGQAPSFNRMVEQIERISPTEVSVLLLGEPGSGREMAARAVHRCSARSRGPFMPVDCSATTEPWLEMELFGSSAGDPSDARHSTGLLEAACGGTLYLNEVGELPLSAQARLLRAFERGKFRPVGGGRSVRADIRLICSTSVEPQSLIDGRRLMPELLLHITGVTIPVPALRERFEDLDLLVTTELMRFESSVHYRLGDGTLAALSSYNYPGNLRELRSILQHGCVLAIDGVILPEHLPPQIGPTLPGMASVDSRA